MPFISGGSTTYHSVRRQLQMLANGDTKNTKRSIHDGWFTKRWLIYTLVNRNEMNIRSLLLRVGRNNVPIRDVSTRRRTLWHNFHITGYHLSSCLRWFLAVGVEIKLGKNCVNKWWRPRNGVYNYILPVTSSHDMELLVIVRSHLLFTSSVSRWCFIKAEAHSFLFCK